jgi:hypothetical protein
MKAVDERLLEKTERHCSTYCQPCCGLQYATLMQGQAKRERDDDMTKGNTKSRLNRNTVTFHDVAINPFNPMAFFGLLAYNHNRIYENSSCTCHPNTGKPRSIFKPNFD